MKQTFTEWLEFQNSTTNKDNIFSPPMSDSTAVQFLKDYLLGDDWYVTDPLCSDQINTQIVYDILCKYSRKFRKELKQFEKWKNR